MTATEILLLFIGLQSIPILSVLLAVVRKDLER